MSGKSVTADLRAANDLINEVVVAIENRQISPELKDRFDNLLSKEKFGDILTELFWSELGILDILKFLGTFRFGLVELRIKIAYTISAVIEDENNDKEFIDKVSKRFEELEQRIIDCINILPGTFLILDSTGLENQKSNLNMSSPSMNRLSSDIELHSQNLQDGKIATILSVKQLGFWIRLQKEHGILEGDNIALLVRRFSQYYSSKRMNNISEQSLYNEYFDTTQVDAAVIRSVLKNMLQYIDRHYFP